MCGSKTRERKTVNDFTLHYERILPLFFFLGWGEGLKIFKELSIILDVQFIFL